MTTQAILDQMLLVVLNISFWNGRKALSSSDLAASGIDVDKLPQGALDALENKMMIPSDTVKTFSSLKREAIALCLNNGVRFGWEGYALPREMGSELLQELKRLKDRFESARANFLSVYEQDIQKWIVSHPPELVPTVRKLVQSASYLHEAICFNYAAFDAKTPAGIGGNGIDQEVNGLYGQLCQDVRATASRTFEYYFVGRQEITRKTLRPLKAIRTKLSGMLFLDPSIAETVRVIDDTLKQLPKYGAIKGAELNMVAGLLERVLANMGRTVPPVQDVVNNEQAPDVIVPPETVVAENTGKVAPIAWDF